MSKLFFDAGPEPFNNRKTFLATTVYDTFDASYTFAMSRSREALHKANHPTAYLILQANCHVDDGRNFVVKEFLASDCSELVFIDSDVVWEPSDLLSLLKHSVDLVGGVYPYRKEGARLTHMPCRTLEGVVEPHDDGLLQVEGLPTGFMRIQRKVLEQLAERAPRFNKGDASDVPLIFERDILNGGRRGGDIRFCMKWREIYGSVWADANLNLGHVTKGIVRDSLAASLRRQMGTSVNHVVGRIKSGKWQINDLVEAKRAVDNNFGAIEDTLAFAVAAAEKADGHVLEIGSGLSTILMAAAIKERHKVWTLEHEPYWADQLESMAGAVGVGSNIMRVLAPLKDGWYDADEYEGIPERFALAFVDGPPRALGDRYLFFKRLAERCDKIIADDADDERYAENVIGWAVGAGYAVKHYEDRVLYMTREGA